MRSRCSTQLCAASNKRDGERNETLDTFVYGHIALLGLISMGLRLNAEVEELANTPTLRSTEGAAVIRSSWMGTQLVSAANRERGWKN